MDIVPETFVDAFGEMSFRHGMIRIELVSLSEPEPRTTRRLIVSLPAFRQMLQAQNRMLQQLEQAGLIQPASAAAPEPGVRPEPPGSAGEATEGGGAIAAMRRPARLEAVLQSAAPAVKDALAPGAAAIPGPPKSPNFDG